MVSDSACTIVTKNMLKAQAPGLLQRYGFQPLRLSEATVTHNYISWAFPKRKSWADVINSAMLHLSAGGITELMVLREIHPR